MQGFGKTGTVRVPAMASSDRSRAAEIYDHYGVGLYGQALLTLGHPALAEHVVCDVIIDECALFPPRGRGEADARHRRRVGLPALSAAGRWAQPQPRAPTLTGRCRLRRSWRAP
jgi:hypothetical protein